MIEFFFFACYLDFEVEETAVFVSSSGGLQVELCGASWLGQFCRFKHVVMINADESVLKLHQINVLTLQEMVLFAELLPWNSIGLFLYKSVIFRNVAFK